MTNILVNVIGEGIRFRRAVQKDSEDQKRQKSEIRINRVWAGHIHTFSRLLSCSKSNQKQVLLTFSIAGSPDTY